jgi:hypothetical protein
MGLFDKLRGGQSIDIEEELGSLDLEGDLMAEEADMWVKPYTLDESLDVDAVGAELKEGNIVLLNIDPLKKKSGLSNTRLLQVVSALKGRAQEADGDIVRVGEDRIVITPTGVKFWKK